ncbi:unnamed protein product [Fraxinus pennsylvanica]|uniref:Uncharacterized protein n=1 Tax=Fraxinus pennsylvanica TaxID=56036 RepID=A0AAD2ABQ4_9LAMI|nr:unnamed protein product [Fraxinus pennsylvanica]
MTTILSPSWHPQHRPNHRVQLSFKKDSIHCSHRPWVVSLLEFSVLQRISPVCASNGTHPPALVVRVDGWRVKGRSLPFLIFVYMCTPSVAASNTPFKLPGPAFYKKSR